LFYFFISCLPRWWIKMIINAENRDFLKTKFSTLGAPVPTLPPQLRWQRRLLCCGRQRNVWSWDVEESHRSCLASVPASSSSCARVPKIYRNNTSPYHAARWLFRSVILSPGPCTGGEGYSPPYTSPTAPPPTKPSGSAPASLQNSSQIYATGNAIYRKTSTEGCPHSKRREERVRVARTVYTAYLKIAHWEWYWKLINLKYSAQNIHDNAHRMVNGSTLKQYRKSEARNKNRNKCPCDANSIADKAPWLRAAYREMKSAKVSR